MYSSVQHACSVLHSREVRRSCHYVHLDSHTADAATTFNFHTSLLLSSCVVYADQPGSSEKLVLQMNSNRDTVPTAIVSYDPTAAAAVPVPAAAGAGAAKAAAAAGGINPIQTPSEHASLLRDRPKAEQ
jgi:hypothetical protein